MSRCGQSFGPFFWIEWPFGQPLDILLENILENLLKIFWTIFWIIIFWRIILILRWSFELFWDAWYWNTFQKFSGCFVLGHYCKGPFWITSLLTLWMLDPPGSFCRKNKFVENEIFCKFLTGIEHLLFTESWRFWKAYCLKSKTKCQ